MKYDLVIYGATGFTGKLAVAYTARMYGKKLKWAIAGRSRERLEVVRKEQGKGYPDIVIADSNDKDSLTRMCEGTKVIATTAGPFYRYGSLLVAACVETGCDYCDITGETDWVREMIATHDDRARETGSRVVHFCGHDCVPWDLTTLMLANKIKEKDGEEELKSVNFYDKIKSKPSGGTIETAMSIMFGEKKKKPEIVKNMGFDPLRKPRESKAQPNNYAVSVKNVPFFEMAEKGGPYRTLFFMAGVNANCVKRSNALNKYGTHMRYTEGQAFSSAFKAFLNLFTLIMFGLCLFIAPLRWFLREYVLYKPGEGMTEEEMLKGYLNVRGVAKGTKGTVTSATITFPVDPGYLDTARMLVECALSLSLDASKIENKQGGVYTPASCQGKVLLDRLCATGSSFSFDA